MLLAQMAGLVQTFWAATFGAMWFLPIALVTASLRHLLPGCDGRCDGDACFYEVRRLRIERSGVCHRLPPPPEIKCQCCLQGTVMHSRKQPKQHRFRLVRTLKSAEE